MPKKHIQHREKATENSAILSNVKKSRQYERCGEYVRYFTIDEFRLFTDAIDRQEHKLMMFLIPLSGTGCRVGEFVQIRLKHLDFLNSAVFFPAANTKTKHQRSSHIPRGLMNDIVMYLRAQNRMAKRTYRVFDGEDFLFRPHHCKQVPYTTNRIRQIFLHYVRKAGLDREYSLISLAEGFTSLPFTRCVTPIACITSIFINSRFPSYRGRLDTPRLTRQ